MSENKGVLVYCEVNEGKLAPVAEELLGAGCRLAAALGQELSAVLLGGDISRLAPEVIACGAHRVYTLEDPILKDYAPEPYLEALDKILKEAAPAVLLLGHTAIGRDLAPRLAFRLNTAVSMDCLALEIDPANGRMLATRPVYGGNAQVVQVCETDPQIATVRMKTMTPPVKDFARQGQVIPIKASFDPATFKIKVLDRKIIASAGVKLEDARVVVAGGRGIGSESGFKQLQEIADLLKGAVGATRPPCDKKWIDDSRQIGLTGKVISPDLYIAVGLSGASQHLSGCSNAGVIVAINKDPEANVFKAARYGIVADWKTVIPVLAAKIREASG